MGVTGADGKNDLANVDTSDGAVWFTPGSTHTGLETICSGTGQHFIDTNDVVRVASDTHMETILSGNLDEVLVGADTGSFEGFGAQLFVLVGNEMNAEWELIDTSTLSSEIEDTDFRVWDTTVESRLWIWLILAIAVATSWTACHFVSVILVLSISVLVELADVR